MKIIFHLIQIFINLLEINGEMNRITTSQKLTNISDQERKTQTSKNKYGPNNPYPQK